MAFEGRSRGHPDQSQRNRSSGSALSWVSRLAPGGSVAAQCLSVLKIAPALKLVSSDSMAWHVKKY